MLNIANQDVGHFVITYTAPPNSFDPLDFDAANNFNLGRMLYSTPKETLTKPRVSFISVYF